MSNSTGKCDNYRQSRKRFKKGQCYADVIVEVETSEGKTYPIWELFNTGCSNSIILKKFADHKRLRKLLGKDWITYNTYSGKFHASETASVGFRLVKFNKNKQLDFEVVVDTTTNPCNVCYDIIIGTNIIDMMGINIMFSENAIYWDSDMCPMKIHGSFQDRDTVEACYIMATEDPILQQAEER